MLLRERGVEMLHDLLAACMWSQHSSVIQQLAQRIINRCERFTVDGDYVTDDDDDDQQSTGMDE